MWSSERFAGCSLNRGVLTTLARSASRGVRARREEFPRSGRGHDRQERCAAYNPFAGAGHVAISPDAWIFGQAFGCVPHSLGRARCSLRIVPCDEFLCFDEVGQSRARPANLQVSTPHLANAERTSLSEANAPRSAAAIPASTARRYRASSMTSSHVAPGGSWSASS